MLPGFSIIGSNWLLHMAVLSCTVIGRVDLVEPVTLAVTFSMNIGFARQPCFMAGTIDSFSHGKNVLSYAKHFHCSCHATWPPCTTSIPDTQNKHDGDHGITWRGMIKCKILLTCCSELLAQWYVYFLCRFQRSVSIHSPTGFTF